ncbi:hypothetical protein KGF54_002275 [Candida jiufengensis]|uniref:uncharacterized protein n=1 Tax=Candida jiufengensis TaxID=497108 RepID=UPI002224FD8B|nr:uncharacterized protein KGF54_002275 [Candida jiufengensis]KAI5954500.1 hypothetical protein KGF54_002275 [Candida jiufengensis]
MSLYNNTFEYNNTEINIIESNKKAFSNLPDYNNNNYFDIGSLLEFNNHQSFSLISEQDQVDLDINSDEEKSTPFDGSFDIMSVEENENQKDDDIKTDITTNSSTKSSPHNIVGTSPNLSGNYFKNLSINSNKSKRDENPESINYSPIINSQNLNLNLIQSNNFSFRKLGGENNNENKSSEFLNSININLANPTTNFGSSSLNTRNIYDIQNTSNSLPNSLQNVNQNPPISYNNNSIINAATKSKINTHNAENVIINQSPRATSFTLLSHTNNKINRKNSFSYNNNNNNNNNNNINNNNPLLLNLATTNFNLQQQQQQQQQQNQQHAHLSSHEFQTHINYDQQPTFNISSSLPLSSSSSSSLTNLSVPVLPSSNNSLQNTKLNIITNLNKSLSALSSPINPSSSVSLMASKVLPNEPKSIGVVQSTNTSATNKNRSSSSTSENANPMLQSSSSSSNISTINLSQNEKIKRRKHKNSKLGCPNCKKRRVKCSEDLPSCINCIKHKVKCGYLEYTEEQLQELREAKQQNQIQKLTQPRSVTDSQKLIQRSSSSSNIAKNDEDSESDNEEEQLTANVNANRIIKPKAKRQSSASSINKLSDQSSNRKLSVSRKSSSNKNLPKLSTLTKEDDEFVNTTRDKLNIHRQNSHRKSVTQNFDNLLSTEDENEIIYPVYKIQSESISPDEKDKLRLPTHHLQDDINIDSPQQYQTPQQFHSMTPLEHQHHQMNSQALPGAIYQTVAFKYKKRKEIDYSKFLLEVLKAVGPAIHKGEANLFQIRELYTLWLNSFIFKGYTSHLMFMVLLNLSANYLISNCFNDTYKYYSSDGEISSISRGIELARVRQTCLVKSIHYYAEVIKSLRTLLNTNADPDTAGSVSYILSLMSVYDPESSLNSTVCFREGLFGVLTYNINSSMKSGKVPRLVPTHLKLMANIVSSIHFPGYDPTFIIECQSLFIRFGEILLPMIEHGKVNSTSNQYLTHQFLELKYKELLQFLNESIEHYLPQINNNLFDMELQQRLLYDLIIKWVKMFPGKFIANKKTQGPMEKILYLFYKLVKKSLLAIFPQIKFFFLRDFDSPLMMDVFASNDDYDIYKFELQNPSTMKFDFKIYQPFINELKYISSYLIRTITFFQLRLSLLYKFLVEHMAQEKFNIMEINQWRNNISDITKIRHEFIEKIGIKEIQITSFAKQYIRKQNYPQRSIGYELNVNELIESSIIDDGNIDFMKLKPSGLLNDDFDIRNEQI